MNDSLGDRMKSNYEDRYRLYLTRRTPVIIRLDGKAFHTVTKYCEKPFDKAFTILMDGTAMRLVNEIQGAKCAYVQSDEISILLTDFDNLTTQAWFDYSLQKLVSVSAGIASGYFSSYWKTPIAFDSRAFNVPESEVANYFVWRQKDWIRNSVQMLAQAHFSHAQLQNKSQLDMNEMLKDKGIVWSNLESRYKNGGFIYHTDTGFEEDASIIFTENRNSIERFLIPNG